jgi:hypothetical protein
MREKRKKIWIHSFQTYLSLRIAVLFVAYQVGGWSLILYERQLIDGISRVAGPGLATHWLLILSGVIVALAGLSIYDSVKFIHRLVGPVYRFRKAIQAITAGRSGLANAAQGRFPPGHEGRVQYDAQRPGATRRRDREDDEGQDRTGPTSVGLSGALPSHFNPRLRLRNNDFSYDVVLGSVRLVLEARRERALTPP